MRAAGRHYRVTNLWDVLERRERTAEWLAKKCGYTGQYLRLIRAGRKPVTEEVARRVSEFLELPVEALFMPIDSHKWDNASHKVEVEKVAD